METIKSEADLEKQVRDVLEKNLDKNEYVVLKNKNETDIVILDNKKNTLFFIEAKFLKFSKSQPEKFERLGVGGEEGSGFQVEVLQEQYPYFEKNLRWLLASEAQEGYWFVTNETIRKYASGGKIEKKYNSIHKDLFEEVGSLNVSQLVEQIKQWIKE